MELRDLRTFVAVAEASGFRRAAMQLGVRQSIVSRRIRDLEDHLGASLFERHRAGARLTYAGSRFLGDVRMVLSRLDSAERAIRVVGVAGEGCLRLGVVASFSTSFLNRLLRRWIAEHPKVALELVEGGPSEHIGLVRSRHLDLTFVTGHGTVLGCDVERLWSEPVLTALPSEHALAGRSVLELPETAGERFLVSRGAPGPEIHDFIVKRLSELDFSPRICVADVGREGLMSMVGLGLGVTLVSGAEAGVIYPGVSFVPVAGEAVPFSAVWAPDNDNPALRRFLSLARVMARKDPAVSDEPSRTLDPSP